MRIKSVTARLATEADSHLPAYDNTKLVAVNTCPTWGVVRYGLHKTLAGEGRALALEAGSACHDVFAAMRLWQLLYYDTENMHSPLYKEHARAEELFNYHGLRLFGEDRFSLMLEVVESTEENETNLVNFAVMALETSGYYDDPKDKKRTLSNIEEACIAYIDRFNFSNPIWIRDVNDPKSGIGVEITFDLVLDYCLVSDELAEEGEEQDTDGFLIEHKYIRFTGQLDGLHVRDDGTIRIEENKTTSMSGEAWQNSFEMASQVTGYCVAASTWTETQINKAIVIGLTIPLPKFAHEGITRIPLTREKHQLEEWFNWFLWSVELYERYIDTPLAAPKFTHSCNRYFRTCSMLPYCVADPEEKGIILDEMRVEEWNPLARKIE